MAAIITDIGTVLAGLVANIPTVVTAIMGVDILAYMIYASIGLALIYFVVRLVKSFTGNKLGGGRKKR